MATQGVGQPSGKKRSFLLRDIFKLCRSISKFLPRDKPKHEQKLHTESKPIEKPKFHVSNDPLVFNSQETDKVEGVSLCRVRSYRLDKTDFVSSKKTFSFSRSSSRKTATATATAAAAAAAAAVSATTNPTLSFIGRSKSSRNRTDQGFTPTLIRSTTTVPRSLKNPILYSSSSARVAKPPPTEEKLSCTLEELCNGCTKKIKIKRDVITSTGQMSEEEEMVEIKVKPGWKGGTKVTFEGKGNEAIRSVPADLTFVIVEKDHKVFKREGDDLEMSVEISLLEALTGFELSVSLPDGDNMSLRIQDVIHPGYVTVIQGKGMPIPKAKGNKRGDLRVRFQTKFPNTLTDEQKAEIRSILQDSS